MILDDLSLHTTVAAQRLEITVLTSNRRKQRATIIYSSHNFRQNRIKKERMNLVNYRKKIELIK